MQIERETVVEIVVSAGPVLALLGVLVYIGTQYTDAATGLTPTGGQAVVGAIAGFVVVMTIIGITLAYSDHGDEDD